MASTDEEKAQKVKATMASHKDSVQHPKNAPRESLLDDSTTSSEVDEAMGVRLAKKNSNIVQKRQVSPAATTDDDSSAEKRSSFAKYGASSSSYSTKNHEPGHRRTLNKKDFYSKTAARIRENGFPTLKQSTRCTCQAELQELQKAVERMNNSLGRLTQTLGAVVVKINTTAQDARIHRKGTQRLIAAANGENTPTDSEDNTSDDSVDEGATLW